MRSSFVFGSIPVDTISDKMAALQVPTSLGDQCFGSLLGHIFSQQNLIYQVCLHLTIQDSAKNTFFYESYQLHKSRSCSENVEIEDQNKIIIHFIVNYITHMTTNTATTKKPFFSCCSAEEQKKEVYVDLSERKQTPVSLTPPVVVPVTTTTVTRTVVSSNPAPKIRFSYVAPSTDNQAGNYSYPLARY